MSRVPNESSIPAHLRRVEQTALAWLDGDEPRYKLAHLVDAENRARCRPDARVIGGWFGPTTQVDCPDCQAWLAAEWLRQDNER